MALSLVVLEGLRVSAHHCQARDQSVPLLRAGASFPQTGAMMGAPSAPVLP